MKTTTDPLVSLFLELIKIDALSGREKPVADYIIRFLTDLGFEPFTDDSAAITGSDTGNVVCKINGGGDFVVLCHMDTARTTKEVKPVFHDDRITSDGTTILGADDRAGISAVLFALRKAVAEKKAIRPFTLVFTTCEESTLLGSKSLQLDPAIKSGFVFDTWLPTGGFVNESCGAVALAIDVFGKASHSGVAPEKGINAIQIAVEALAKFSFGRINADTTANIGLIKGGEATNVVPDHVGLEGEVRSKNREMVEQEAQAVRKHFEEAAAKYGGKAQVDIRWDFEPYHISPQEAEYQRVEGVMKRLGLDAKPCLSWGGSDANSLNANGIRAINIGTGAQNPHANEEFILYSDLHNSSHIALELITFW
ncbi:MAG: M20/M25/M40 family metallo-hydrolase [Prevotellaceae bacterium]|jgi:tripeptide aminopeptidase|nr:M20/M25/M40 family metallo-hydrolase [Prevotellaceae bacterium]